MAFPRIEPADLQNKGVIGLPDTPGLSTAAMQAKLEETARDVIIPKHNALLTELEDTTSASNLGASAPTGRPLLSPTVQGVMDKLSSDLKVVEDGMAEAIADAHTHDNKALLDTYTQTETDLADAVSKKHDHSNKALLDTYTQTETDLADAVTKKHSHANKSVIDDLSDDGSGHLLYDGNPVGAVTSVNSQTGAVVLTASDVGALPSTTAIPTKTSDLTNDSGFITSGDIPTIPTKTSDLTNDSNFVSDPSYVHTDNNYDATAKTIVDGATAAIAAKSTVAWNQIDTTGTKIAEITIDGVKTEVKATGGGGSADAYKTIDAGGQSFVASGADTFKINAGSNVTITPLTGDKGIQISAAGGGTSTGDMLMNDYDRSGDVKSASSSGNGIKDYVASAISGKADTSSLATVATTGAYSDLSGKPTLSTVATSGSYNDLSNKPTIPAAVAVKGDSESTYRTGNVNLTKANIGLGNVGNFKAVSTVASQGLTDTEKSNARTNIGAGTSSFSGSYNDLSNKPTIPTVNNGQLTIQQNGTNKATFTANQNGNATANIITDTWTSTATVSSSGTVSFSGLNDSYGYKIYYTLPSGDSAYTFSKVTKTGSGTSVTLTYTTDAPSGTVCKLRILK